jgi:hypothetical protein
MQLSTQKIIGSSMFFAIPALASLLNVVSFVVIPNITNFEEFRFFILANVFAGIYLNSISHGAHNISVVQFESGDSQVLKSYQMVSVTIMALFLLFAIYMNNFSVFFLVLAYFIQQQIVIMVMLARQSFDGVRAKSCLLLQPLILLSLLLIFSEVGLQNFWIYATLISAILGAGLVMAIENISIRSLFIGLPRGLDGYRKVLLILFSGSAVPLFIHMDMLVLKDSANLAEFAIFSKMAYSIPMSLCSLLIYPLFKDKGFLRAGRLFPLVFFVSVASIAAWTVYLWFFNVTFAPNLFVVFCYVTVFTVFNLVFSLSVLQYPEYSSKLTALTILSLCVFTLVEVDIVAYMVVKIVLMIFVVLMFINRLKVGGL